MEGTTRLSMDIMVRCASYWFDATYMRRSLLGCIIDLFNCDERFNKAIEVTAEGRLFYHVVDNDKIAMKLLKVMNDRELRGEVNFFPISRMTAKEKRNVIDKVSWQVKSCSMMCDYSLQEAKPMLNEMHYDETYDVIFRAIFANSVFVKDLKAGQRVSKQERFDCVTLEGSQYIS